jgi:hypothetical protein
MGIVGVRGITTTASGTDLTIALPQGTAANQVLKWDGNNWTPQQDAVGATGDISFYGRGRDGIEVSTDGANWSQDAEVPNNASLFIRPDPDKVPSIKNFYVTDEYGGISRNDVINGWHHHLASTRFCRQIDENGHFAPGTEWWNAPEQDPLVWTWGFHGIPYEEGNDDSVNDQLWRVTCYRSEEGRIVDTDVDGNPVPGMPTNGRIPTAA